MTIESDLVAWAATRPDWQRDVLVRICRHESIDAESIAERLISGVTTPARTLAAADVPGTTVAGGVQLVALHDLAGVNALALDQQLTFGSTGLTVIYGDNASGKSGYARVLKAAVGARVREDSLSDVFAANGPVTQSAMIDYQVAGAEGDQQWKWPGVAHAQLQQVHFYDEASGDAYIGVESEITYRPSALILLDQLIVVCDEVRAVLERRLREVDAERESMPVLPGGTPAARFLAGLKATTTKAEITAACAVPADANEALGRLLSEEARLKASDPTKERDHLVALAGHLEVVAAHCDQLIELLGHDGVEKLILLRSSATELRAAAAVASSQTFDAEPVTGVGSTTWRALWEAARAFSEHEAYHGQEFPVTGGSARCLLCHQALSAEAGERLLRFRRFMSDTTEREAAQAERSLAAAGQAVQEYRQVPPAVAAAIAQIRSADAALADTVDTWTNNAAQHAAAAVSWLNGVSDEQPVPVGVSPGVMLSQLARQLREHAATIDAVTFAAQLKSTSGQVATLQGQLALAASKGAVVAEVGRLRRRAQIETAKKATDTGAITRRSSELTRDHVTREVRDQFTRESERLRLRRITRDSTSAVKGRLRHRPALLGAARSAAVTKVLSEGEQTALGLSGFFTEVIFAPTKSAVVLDDPVTSLDHARRSLVAARLVELAADRQVIVFTHEVTFVGDLVRHANEGKVPITERWIQRNGDVLGVCADKHPWKAKDVTARIGVLDADLAAIKRNKNTWDQEQYEEQCAAWAGKLSEAWERAVNLEIVNEVVDRGTSQVRPMKFRILAAITEQDNDEFQAGYGRCSEWARRHDKDPGINFVAPEPGDLEAELERLRAWFKRIKTYRG
jgi:ABC-type hemin transport system ATPase subunit